MLSLKPGLILALGALLVASVGGATVAADAKKSPVAVVETSLGTVEIELDPERAPVTVKNFVGYAKKGFYNGTIFHRVISDFMIQGGGFTPELEQKKTEAPITNEAGNGLKNTRGTIAMARTPDPNSATAQFFINVKDNEFLNHQNETAQGFGYAVFGKVTKGMDVVDKIKDVKTGVKESPRGALGDTPVDTVLIKSVTIKE